VDPEVRPLFEAATRPYIGVSRHTWHFARGKLRHDPVFFSLLRRGLLPDRGSLLDLGCGQGILLSLLKAAKEQYQAGVWPRDWPAPPSNLGLRGIELRADRVQAARRALGDSVQVDQRDLRDLDLRPCSVIIMLDVLLYLAAEEQQRLLGKAAAALEAGGMLLMREADAGAGFAFRVTKWSERIAGALRGEFGQRLHYRSAVQWIAELVARGFAVSTEPMSGGTPFANVLFVAKKSPTPQLKPQMNTDNLWLNSDRATARHQPLFHRELPGRRVAGDHRRHARQALGTGAL
jgi:SAM-dependent methyltransferase